MQRIPFGLAPIPFRFAFGGLDVQARLKVHGADERIGVEKQLEKMG